MQFFFFSKIDFLQIKIFFENIHRFLKTYNRMSNTFDYILIHLIMLIIYHWEVGGMKMWRSIFGQQYGQQCWLMYNISKFTNFLSSKEFRAWKFEIQLRWLFLKFLKNKIGAQCSWKLWIVRAIRKYVNSSKIVAFWHGKRIIILEQWKMVQVC